MSDKNPPDGMTMDDLKGNYAMLEQPFEDLAMPLMTQQYVPQRPMGQNEDSRQRMQAAEPPGNIAQGALKHRFTYHPPFEGQVPRYEGIREMALDFAVYLHEVCPPSRDLTRAFNKLDECVMLANAAIARNE